ncbi:MAG TPA: carboxymuconolactone decarboxylase family protein [Candidatus Pseudogracilibacillus intestinigallinarum]|uniref:Carboxymuconolactone decarboxylase family protein n=1 Tax=Candidatus Pseudogracilibacillus intestinigallinarum TaxID=2838742 RepID=A0A9D1TKB9_9BACI|nr:carboxymuconolactone decarboxylase family protein [Candidatus Pseudogracilibacillus intestinigallinarum]
MASERYEKGMDVLKDFNLVDQHHPEGHMDIGAGFKDLAPDLEDFVVEFAFGDIYGREGIDPKQKVLVTMASLVAQGIPQIEMHVKTGIKVGLTPEEIVGAIIHILPYAGFPKVLNGLKAVQKVFSEQGITVKTK